MAAGEDGHRVDMSESQSDLPPDLDLAQVAREDPHDSVAAEEEAVAGEPGWDADDTGGTVPTDDAQ